MDTTMLEQSEQQLSVCIALVQYRHQMATAAAHKCRIKKRDKIKIKHVLSQPLIRLFLEPRAVPVKMIRTWYFSAILTLLKHIHQTSTNHPQRK